MSLFPSENLCPSTITTRQELSESVPGWEAGRSKYSHFLSEIWISSGHPSGMEFLLPDKIREKKGQETSIWRLPPTTEYWVQCRYLHTYVVLSKRLSKEIRSCSVVIDRNGVPIISSCSD
jgi:hypothetical protein